MIPNDFHFERPYWFLALIPALLVLWSTFRAAGKTSAWRQAVDPHLLRHLLLPGETGGRSSYVWLLALGWLAAIIAMSGPSWEKVPQPTTKTIEPTVVALGMSPSMDAEDVTPSRLARARYKLQDVLQRSAGGQVGLVIYSDEPFVVSPLTDDGRVIQEMIPTLESSLMPGRGNRPDRAIDQSVELLKRAGMPGGRILLFADSAGDDPEATRQAAARAAQDGRELSVLGIGTEQGVTLRDARGETAKGPDGKPLTLAVDPSQLTAIANAGGGRFAMLSPSSGDLDTLLALPSSATVASSENHDVTAGVDVWRDAGVYFLLIPVLLAPFAFRRGWLAVAVLTVLLGAADARASVWQDLWQTRDQQGASALASGDAAQAADLFEAPDWRAAAQYQSGNYEEATKAYASLEGIENKYNNGNSLARAGKLEEAIQAYDQVLEQKDDHEDAKFNRDLVKKLLEQQKQQQQQQQQNQQNQQGQGEQDKQDQSQSGGSQGSENESSKDQSAQGEQNQQQDQKSQGQEQAKQDSQSQDSKGEGSQDQAAQEQESKDQAAPGKEDEKQKQDSSQQASAQASASQEQKDGSSPEQKNENQHEQKGASAAESPEQQKSPESEDQRTAGNAGTERDDQQASAKRPEPTDTSKDQEELRDQVNRALEAQKAEQEDEKTDERGNAIADSTKKPITEQEQAREQRLRQIPDDPGGLLRAKIQRRYAEKRYSQRVGAQPW